LTAAAASSTAIAACARPTAVTRNRAVSSECGNSGLLSAFSIIGPIFAKSTDIREDFKRSATKSINYMKKAEVCRN
jgi:hypothetical protein